jgi:hypothetical protein
MPLLNYAQTLDKVEAFMEASGIRAFCTNMCKGDCCSGCYESKEACHKHEGRRMSCSVYLCYFKTTGIGGDLMTPFKEASTIIHDESSRVYTKYRSGIRNNSYFYPPPKQIFTDFEIAEVPLPSYFTGFTKGRTCLSLVKAGLSLTYARKIKIMMNKITRLGHEVMASRPPGDTRKGVRLSQFKPRRKKVRQRHVWNVEYYNY